MSLDPSHNVDQTAEALPAARPLRERIRRILFRSLAHGHPERGRGELLSWNLEAGPDTVTA
jgi:hypothetical protein